MKGEQLTRGLISYFKSDQWQELMRQLTQTEEELYHTHMYVENSVDAESICKLFEKYFERKGMPLDRKIDILGLGVDRLAAHNVHPHDPEKALYTPHFDFWYRYNPEVAVQPSDPSKFGECGKNILTWGKRYMDNFYKQFDFSCIGPKEEREISRYFQSAHWKKGLRLIEDPLYNHIHINLEINFDPDILKVLVLDVLKEIGWKVDHVVPNVFTGYDGKYLGKLVFLGAYPEAVYDVSWDYNPDVVIRPASVHFGTTSFFVPEDGDIRYNAVSVPKRDVLLSKYKWQELTDEEIEKILDQV